ncbi:MAG: adenylate/guanylate cyclase domain-containing protein, partial [Gammaproteobacteria bacterium]|nr:adenylate/guanylate cyclase domain-containing protein [Gammaproteobacteria bacterium]
MAAEAKLKQTDSKREIKALPTPVTKARTKNTKGIVDLVVVPPMAASSPANRMDSELLEIDTIIEEVSHAIATNDDQYKCIMFTDLESSTEYKRAMGHSKGYMRNRLFCDICENAVKRHKGHVVKRLGDGVMVVFENAIDAVLASLLIKRSIAANRKKLKKIVGPMNYRIGITCGYVKQIPGRTKDYIGHAMDKGARIQTHARRNQVLIDEIVFGLIHTKIRDYSGDIVIGKPNNMTLKGVGVSTLYEVSPKNLGLESSMF